MSIHVHTCMYKYRRRRFFCLGGKDLHRTYELVMFLMFHLRMSHVPHVQVQWYFFVFEQQQFIPHIRMSYVPSYMSHVRMSDIPHAQVQAPGVFVFGQQRFVPKPAGRGRAKKSLPAGA